MSHPIELRDLQKVVDQRLVVDVTSLIVQSGEIAALVGPPGSGKTILLDLLIGRSRPTAGTVRVAGLEPSAQKAQFSTA